MFKCKECGCEYKEKPDFCDCGNDEFDEVLSEETKQIVQENKTSPKTAQKTSIPNRKISKQKIEPYAIIIFALCILFSFVILFFIGNPKENSPKTTTPQQTIKTEIPSIDSLWNSSVVGIEKYNQKTLQPPAKEQIKPIVKTVSERLPKVVEKNTTVKKVAENKPASKVKESKPKEITTPKPTKPTVQPTSQAKQNTNSAVVDVKELNNYKIQLRNRIASKIDFTQVMGDGSCVLSFTISSDGTLLNRKFEKQSDNDSLNDVVFNAMYTMTSYNRPPIGYKGEILRLRVKIVSGQFEVSLN